MLGTLEKGDKVRWRDFVQPTVHAYNCTKNDTTSCAPYELLRLPIDIISGLSPEGNLKQSHSEYIKLKENLMEPAPESQEHNEDFDVSILNGPEIEPEDVGDHNSGASQVQHSLATEIFVRSEESLPNVIATDLSEHCCSTNEAEIRLGIREEMGNVKEQTVRED